jgi:transposase-like protein
MTWRCPACRLEIAHHELEQRPRPGVRYRCHVCRLELVVDPKSRMLTVAPLPEGARDERRH